MGNWLIAIEEEHERMLKSHVWTVVDRESLRIDELILSATWAMKKKSNGQFRARVVVRGYEQVDSEHFHGDDISSPVVNEVTVRIVLILMVIFKLSGGVMDVEGAFLLGLLDPGVKLYISIPKGFEKYYKTTDVLSLNRTMYGTKQAAKAFWNQLLLCLQDMGFSRSHSDPCLYFKISESGPIFILSWVDDLLIIGSSQNVSYTKTHLKQRFDCTDVGELTEYVGCKIASTERGLKLTQPVILQSFADEFNIVPKTYSTPAIPHQVLMDCGAIQSDSKTQAQYRSGVGKLLYVARWSRPDIANAVRELTKFNGKCGEVHVVAMRRVMAYLLNTRTHGLK